MDSFRHMASVFFFLQNREGTSEITSLSKTMFFLVSTYLVCERLSVMQRQTRLPEIFDQIPQFTPEVEYGFSGGGGVWGVDMEFSSKFRSELFHITPPSPRNSNTNFFL